MQKFTTFLWFTGTAEEAMNFYIETFGGKIKHIERYTGDMGIPSEDTFKGKVLTGVFELDGQEFMCIDGPKMEGFGPSSAISIMVRFDDQDELDKVWDKLMDGGKPQQCGWISDRFGVTWQIVPTIMDKLMSDPSASPEQKKALMQAMMPMQKLDGNKLKEAFDAA